MTNWGLDFPIENYVALYVAIIGDKDIDSALKTVFLKRGRRLNSSKAERVECCRQAKALQAKGYSINRIGPMLKVKSRTLYKWLKKEKNDEII